ncbi:unnamed protein product [Effrenium voratum]|nr:unnamed protein product [Effrenium voratum]
MEEELSRQAMELQSFRGRAEEALKLERQELSKEKQRLAMQSQVLADKQQNLMRLAENASGPSRNDSEELIAAVNKEKAALVKERERLQQQAEAIQAARQQLAMGRNRGQELAELRVKAQALEAEAEAIQRERAALEKQRRRIQAEAEDIAEERESLAKEAKALHKAVNSDAKPKVDKKLLSALRAAEKQLSQQTEEFRNFKSRVENEAKSLEERALAKAAKPLLAVLDDVQRARLAATAKGLSAEGTDQILRPLRKRLVGVLQSEFNVRPLPNAVGEVFNPEIHEAISLREEDEYGPDVVVEQLEEGFEYGDSGAVLRPAKADAAYGLPTHFAERLSEAWYRGGALTALRPRSQPPAGWEMVFSRSVGLFYYCRVGSTRAQWRYPEAAPDVQPDVPNLLENFDRGKPHSGSVPYVELDFRGHPLCLLCKGRGLEHFASAGHAENVRVWGAIHHRLTDLERDLRVQSTFLDSSLVMLSAKENSALAQVWLSEIRRTAQDLQEDETKPKAAACAFWHLALGPSAPATRLAHVQQDLDRTLTHAGLPEPRWSTMQWKHRLPVQPGEDFPWPRPSTLKLSETTPPEVFDALSGQALKGEGIAAQADGTLWCAYCDRAVPELSSHLNRKSVEALEHVECRGQATTVVAKLRERGCQLRREGIVISKGRFHCGLCNTSGGWLRIFHHCSSHAHLAAYGNFQRNNSPEAIQAKLNSDKHKEAEESAWKAAFDAMSKIA